MEYDTALSSHHISLIAQKYGEIIEKQPRVYLEYVKESNQNSL